VIVFKVIGWLFKFVFWLIMLAIGLAICAVGFYLNPPVMVLAIFLVIVWGLIKRALRKRVIK
jgi:hypothetical protein